MRRKHKKHIIKTWILSIAALAVGIVFVSPLYLVFVNSVKTVREIYLSPLGLPVEISWNNFGRVMEKIDFGQALKNSLFFVVFGVAGLLVICSMAAYRLARHRTRVNKFVYLLLVSSILVPFQTVMIPLIKIIASIGLYNTRIGVLLAYYGYDPVCGLSLLWVPEQYSQGDRGGCADRRWLAVSGVPLYYPSAAETYLRDGCRT